MLDFLFAFAFVVFWLFALSLLIYILIKLDLRDVDHTLVYLGRKGNYLSFAIPYKDCYFGFYSIYYSKKKYLNCEPFDLVSVSVSFLPFSGNGVKLTHIHVLDPSFTYSSAEDKNKNEVI